MEKQKKYYNKEIENVLEAVRSSHKGLTENEAARRIKRDGLNQLPKPKRARAFLIFLSQFANPLVLVVLVAMACSVSIGHITDAVFIVIVVLINSVVGFVQENKSERALEKLNESVRFYCKVIRDGVKRRVNSQEIAIGDLIEVQPGDKVPADGRLIYVNDLKISEAMLTGEWMAVSKSKRVVREDVGVAERKNMVYMGTIVEEGEGVFVVTNVGVDTEIGKISTMVGEQKEVKTPIQKKFQQLSRKMVLFILLAVISFSVMYLWQGESLYNVFITSIALMVSAVPEGLLPAVTVVLVMIMRRLSRKKALVRKLDATEGMGAISVICMDKTGTLTRGEMTVSHILAGESDLLEKNSGFKKRKKFKISEEHLLTLEAITLVNEAYIENPEDEISEWNIRGRHTDRALLLAGINAGIDKKELEETYKILRKISFTSRNKYAAQIFRTDGKVQLFFLGSPESAIEKSSFIYNEKGDLKITDRKRKEILMRLNELSMQGLRVLAVGCREMSVKEYEKKKYDDDELLKDLSFLGIVALKDPLRKDAKESVVLAMNAGIKPVVITGDHRNTAEAIIRELGMRISPRGILEGEEVERMSDEELSRRVKSASIFARVAPEHKIRIVKALQRNGEIVAMVGDGVNDAPALKVADIGISVDSGTDISKEVADIVLLDESFSVIIKAIEQGRLARDNIRKVLIYLLADDFSELLLFFMCVLLGLPFPLYPVQILWINLIEDGFPNMALAMEKDASGVMKRMPDKPNASLLNESYRKFILVVFLVSGSVAFLSYALMLRITGDLEEARSFTFAVTAFDSLVFAYVVKSLGRSFFSFKIFLNKALNWTVFISGGLLLIGFHVPFMNNFLRTVSLSPIEWVVVVAIGVLEAVVFDITRRMVRL